MPNGLFLVLCCPCLELSLHISHFNVSCQTIPPPSLSSEAGIVKLNQKRCFKSADDSTDTEVHPLTGTSNIIAYHEKGKHLKKTKSSFGKGDDIVGALLLEAKVKGNNVTQ